MNKIIHLIYWLHPSYILSNNNIFNILKTTYIYKAIYKYGIFDRKKLCFYALREKYNVLKLLIENGVTIRPINMYNTELNLIEYDRNN